MLSRRMAPAREPFRIQSLDCLSLFVVCESLILEVLVFFIELLLVYFFGVKNIFFHTTQNYA